MDKIWDIIIIGAGPVGLMAANLLGQRGQRVLLLDKTTIEYSIPRAIHIDDEIVRIFQAVGLLEPILKISKPVSGMQFINRKGKVLLETSMDGVSGFEGSYLFFSSELEEVLRQGLKRFPQVNFLLGHKAIAIDQTEDCVTTTVEINQGETKKIQGKYLLACDGAKSFVRDYLGIGLQSFGFKSANLKVDTELEKPYPLPEWIQKTCKDFSNHPPFVFLNGRGSHRRWEFSLYNASNKEELEEEETTRKFLEKVIPPAQVKILHAAVYRFYTKIAKRWRVKRVFLAGDAAHQMPPYIGQGMCAGMRDVFNLSWKLDAVLRGKVPQSWLKSYQNERFKHARTYILLTMLVGFLFISKFSFFLHTIGYIVPEKWRKFRLKPIALKGGLFFKSFGNRVGQLMMQANVCTAKGEEDRLDAFLKQDFSILSWKQNPLDFLSTEDKEFLNGLGCTFIKISDQFSGEQTKELTLLKDSTDKLGKWFGKNKKNCVIIRPDRYVLAHVEAKHLSNAVKSLRAMK